MSVRFGEGFFPSKNGVSRIYYCHYTPDLPKGCVLLVHGMGSHAGRYQDLITFLTEHAYAVYAYDLAGHGKSVGEGEIFGSFAEQDGDVALVKDLEDMVKIVRKRFRHLPLFVFAHSLGSFVARAFIASHGEELDGVILSGTTEVMHYSFFKKRKLMRLVKKAGRSYSKEVERLMLGRLVYPLLKEKGGWLTSNPESLPPKGSDPLYGHKLTADAYYDIYRLIDYISSDEWLSAAPRFLPILFLSGERDVLGGYGEGIHNLAEQLDENGFSKVAVTIYPGEKHELLGSLSDGAVKADLLAFLEEESEAIKEIKRQRIGHYDI